MSEKKFSVITPSLNQGAFIGKAIQSVLDQNYPDFEHWVIDGGSTDGTLEALKKYPHLKWVSEPDRGKAEALNKGFRKAAGEVIAWISADDYYEADAFNKVKDLFVSNPDCQVVVGGAAVVDEKGRFLFMHEAPGTRGLTHEGIIRFWKYGSLPQPSIFFRRRVFETVGFLDERIPSYMDYDFFLRLSRACKFWRSDTVFSNIRYHRGSETIRDIAAGRLDRLLFKISRRYWGRPSHGRYWARALSYALHFPKNSWRRYCDRFALECRSDLERIYSTKPFGRFLREARPMIWKYPLPFCLASAKTIFRRAFQR